MTPLPKRLDIIIEVFLRKTNLSDVRIFSDFYLQATLLKDTINNTS